MVPYLISHPWQMFNITILGIISYGFLNAVHRISNKTGFIGLVSIKPVLALSWASIQPVSYWYFFCDRSRQVTVDFYFKLHITGRQPKNINKLYKSLTISMRAYHFIRIALCLFSLWVVVYEFVWSWITVNSNSSPTCNSLVLFTSKISLKWKNNLASRSTHFKNPNPRKILFKSIQYSHVSLHTFLQWCNYSLLALFSWCRKTFVQ